MGVKLSRPAGARKRVGIGYLPGPTGVRISGSRGAARVTNGKRLCAVPTVPGSRRRREPGKKKRRRCGASSDALGSRLRGKDDQVRASASSFRSSWPPPKLTCSGGLPPTVTRIAQYFSSGIFATGSSASLVTRLTAAS